MENKRNQSTKWICNYCWEQYPYEPMYCNDCGTEFIPNETFIRVKEHSNTVTCNQCGKQKSGTVEGICEHCGKFGKSLSTRQQALDWWNEQTFEEQFYFTISWLKSQNRNTTERHPHKLTIEEIEEIWKYCTTNDVHSIYKSVDYWNKLDEFYKEVTNVESWDDPLKQQIQDTIDIDSWSNDKSDPQHPSNAKPNQKQFKKFNAELFKAYISKFSHEDQRHAFSLIIKALQKNGDKISVDIK